MDFKYNDELLNIEFKDNGEVTKREGFKDFKELIKWLRVTNKRLKKLNVKVRYTIDLPLK